MIRKLSYPTNSTLSVDPASPVNAFVHIELGPNLIQHFSAMWYSQSAVLRVCYLEEASMTAAPPTGCSAHPVSMAASVHQHKLDRTWP